MAVTEDEVRRGLAALGMKPDGTRLGAIAAVVEQNSALVATVMAAPLRPRCENAPVWSLPPEIAE
ncbi:hypothetical protein [Roseivivax sediminis]|uniref:DUF4089 domain-containing protein n=1 Tax=Roseivivax sediminis TaxID=936889 RepID=A0A1I1YIS2_9RHOB|nr:hypothetical protein [Roseivivax sediminis]SFE19495.1 hypothetical protein SAMN04515678_10770 [Roseivivax sediminis]